MVKTTFSADPQTENGGLQFATASFRSIKDVTNREGLDFTQTFIKKRL